MPASIIGGIMSGTINAASSAAINEKQMEHNKEMAALEQAYNERNMAAQQAYNKETMSIQNKYQLEQWQRENEYNDPSAVAARFSSAGINPVAVLGGGSSSAGLASSFSSAPSGGSPSSSNPSAQPARLNVPTVDLDTGGIMTSLHQREMRRLQQEKQDAEIAKIYEETKAQQLENERKEFDKANGAWEVELKTAAAKAQFEEAQATMATIRSLSYDYEHKLNLEAKEAANAELFEKINLYRAQIWQIQELTSAQKAELIARVDKYKSDIALNRQQVKTATKLAELYGVQGDKTYNEARLLQMDAIFRTATQGLPINLWTNPTGLVSTVIHTLGTTNRGLYEQIQPIILKNSPRVVYDILHRYAPNEQARKSVEQNKKEIISELDRLKKLAILRAVE